MKRIPLIFFLVLAFFTPRQTVAQQVNEGFESNTFPPPGWDTINVADINGTGTARWVSSNQSGKIHSGSKAAYGQFETQPAPITADNWLITPRIYSIKSTDNLNFYSIANYSDVDNGFFDTLYVLVSTSGKSISDFNNQIFKVVTYSQTSYTQHTIPLGSFVGQNIYIAFRHYNQNGNGIFIDDVTAGTALTNDVANSSLTVSQTGIIRTNSSVDITATLKNVGTNPIAAGLPVKYSVNNGSAISLATTSDMTTTGSTTSVTFSGANAFTPTAPGTYVVKVYADAASEINRGNDTLVYTFTVQNAISSFPYFQDFNNPQGWSFAGTGNWDYSKFETIAGVPTSVINPADNNDSAATARFFFAQAGSIFYLRSPLMNFSGVSKPMLNFYVAYRTATVQNDQLEVVVSLDGGTSYQSIPLLYTKSFLSSPSLSTVAPDATTRYVPASANDWRHEIVDMSAYAGQPSVLIAFKGTSQTGNNLWIDNVNVISQPPTEYVAAKVTAVNQVITGTYNTKVKFNTLPTSDSIRIQSHSFTPPASNFANNTSSTSNDGSITTPIYVFPRFATIAFSGNAIIRANYDISMDYTGLIGISNPDKLYIMKRSDQSGDWVALTTTRSGTVLTAAGLNNFSDFAIGYNSIPLPLNILNFNARLVNNISVLQWKVEQVKNVTSFDVERKTGNSWENIGNVVVTSPSQNDYNFNDVTAHNGINYYRLKINDGNGNFIYSNIVSVTLRTSFLVFQNAPNPFKNYTIIRYEIEEKAPVKIQVFNLSGSRIAVLTDKIQDQGSYEIRFNTSQLTPGNYYLKFTAGDKTEVKKMIRLQ